VEVVTAVLAKPDALPTTILDARLVEEQIGDGYLGPADYRTYIMVTVAPADVAAWQAALTELSDTPAYNAPSQPYGWWPDPDRFGAMRFYAPDSVTGRTHGWIALDSQSGEIFIFTFTT
jgi:hypothetical protein